MRDTCSFAWAGPGGEENGCADGVRQVPEGAERSDAYTDAQKKQKKYMIRLSVAAARRRAAFGQPLTSGGGHGMMCAVPELHNPWNQRRIFHEYPGGGRSIL